MRPDQITDASTLRDIAVLLGAFGLMWTMRIEHGRARSTVSDSLGVIGSGSGSTIAESLRAAVLEFISNRYAVDRIAKGLGQ